MRPSILNSLFPLLATAWPTTTLEPFSVFPHIQSSPHEITPFDNGDYGPYPNQTYLTDPTIISPQLNVLQSDPRCSDGLYTMISLRGDNVMLKGQSPMIFDQKGNLIWMNATYGETFGLTVQRYEDQNYLTFWQGDDSVGGHGEGYYYMLDSSYNEAFKLTAGNGLAGDLHEFRITPEGTVLLTQYKMEETQFGSGRRSRKGYIWDSVIQEVNIKTNEVLFEWHASEHFDINESDFPPGNTGRNVKSGYDFFHINSIDKDYLGNYLISSRYYQSLTYISGPSGEILWTLGGKHNSFTDLSSGLATKFGWQHDARWIADHTGITLFDNGARYGLKPHVDHSRGIHIALDLEVMTAQVVAEFVNPRKIISTSQGSVQVLENGNVLVGYGYNAAWTEFTSEGDVLCDVHVGSQKTFGTGAVQTYHVHKKPWTGLPKTKPLILFNTASGGGEVYMSWNGATEIANWVLQASANKDMNAHPKSILDISMTPKSGFETKAKVDCKKWPFVRAVAVDSKGLKLGMSEVVETFCEEEEEEVLSALGSLMANGNVRMGLELIGITMGAVGMAWVWRWRLARRRGRGYEVVGRKMYGE